ARGYINNGQKTAEAFIENPVWCRAEEGDKPIRRRMYKTGDLVKYNPNGAITFVCRKDSQVKLHGQRIELGEIEHRLSADPQIRHAVVLMPRSGLCKHRLVTILSLHDLAPSHLALSANVCEII